MRWALTLHRDRQADALLRTAVARPRSPSEHLLKSHGSDPSVLSLPPSNPGRFTSSVKEQHSRTDFADHLEIYWPGVVRTARDPGPVQYTRLPSSSTQTSCGKGPRHGPSHTTGTPSRRGPPPPLLPLRPGGLGLLERLLGGHRPGRPPAQPDPQGAAAHTHRHRVRGIHLHGRLA